MLTKHIALVMNYTRVDDVPTKFHTLMHCLNTGCVDEVKAEISRLFTSEAAMQWVINPDLTALLDHVSALDYTLHKLALMKNIPPALLDTVVSFLSECGEDINQKLITHKDPMDILFSVELDVEMGNPYFHFEDDLPLVKNGMTPLYIAAQAGYTAVVQSFLTTHANPNLGTTEDGETPLFVAAKENDLGVARALLANGAEVNQPIADDGMTPLYIASKLGHLTMVLDLLNHGADPNKKISYGGETSLITATETDEIEVVRALLAGGADVNQSTNDGGMSPLLIATRHDNVALVKLLLQYNANPFLQGLFGDCNFIDIARIHGFDSLVSLLEIAYDITQRGRHILAASFTRPLSVLPEENDNTPWINNWYTQHADAFNAFKRNNLAVLQQFCLKDSAGQPTRKIDPSKLFQIQNWHTKFPLNPTIVRTLLRVGLLPKKVQDNIQMMMCIQVRLNQPVSFGNALVSPLPSMPQVPWLIVLGYLMADDFVDKA